MPKFIDRTGEKYGKLTILKRDGDTSPVKWLCQCECGNTISTVFQPLKTGKTKTCGKCSGYGDLTGKRFGKLTVIKPADRKYYYECQCDCGNSCVSRADWLVNGEKKSCGCLNRGAKPTDWTGHRFGRLVAIKLTDNRINHSAVWLCQCDCGNMCESSIKNLTEGYKTSCGCRAIETQKAAKPVDCVSHAFGTIPGKLTPETLGKLQRNNTSGVRGVYWSTSKEKWVATIGFKGKNYGLIVTDNKEKAIAVRKQAEKEIFGSFLDWYEYFKKSEENNND